MTRSIVLLAAAMLVLAAFFWRPLLVSYRVHQASGLMDLGSQSQVEEALQLLSSIQALEPQPSSELLFQLGRAQRRAGSVEKAIEYLDRSQQAGYSQDRVRQQKSLARIQRGEIDQKSGVFRLLLAVSTRDEDAYELYEALTKGYMFSYRFNDAIQCINFWLEWRPETADAVIWRASMWEQMEKWEQAADDYRRILKTDPENVTARLFLARVLLLQLNQTESAYQEFLECLKRKSDDFNSILGAASCERRMAKPDLAEARLNSLLKQDLTQEQTASVKAELAELLLDRGESEAGIQMLEEVVRDDPRNSAAWYALGTGNVALGNESRAQECFAKSTQLREQFGRLSEITATLIGKPDDANLRWEAGRIMMDNGMYTEGAAWMATALIYDPDHVATHKDLAEYYSTVKHDEKRAQYHLQQAGKSSPQKD